MKLLIDTDPGIDDAIALLLAFGTPGTEVVGISTVGGNTSLANTTRNALRLLELVSRTDIPVASGHDVPYQRTKRETGVQVHGPDGFGASSLPAPQITTVSDDAPAFLANQLRQHPDATLVTLGPLTNIAHMLDRFPDAVPARHVMMGGAAHLGNVTPVAEFNVWHDPEAAWRVFQAPLNTVMVGLDATHSIRTMESQFDWLATAGPIGAAIHPMVTAYTNFYASVYGERMSHQHDAIAMAEALWPGLLELEAVHIDVETNGTLTEGMTVVANPQRHGLPANATVAWSAPSDAFHDHLMTALHNLHTPMDGS